MRALLVLLLTLAGPAVNAGPWPRGDGQTYVFTGYEDGDEPYTSLYVEYGLTENLTFGLDAGGKVNDYLGGAEDPAVEARLRAFLRIPVLSSQERRAARPAWLAPWRAAVEVGLGADLERDGETLPRYSLGVTLGRGFDTRFGDGWTTLDLRLTGGGDLPRYNAAIVIGVKPTDRLTAELGLFAEREDSTSWAIAPTLQYELGRIGGARLGVSVKDDATVLRLGWARAF